MKRQSAWKRFGAVLLSAAMVMSSGSFTVLAEETAVEESAVVTEVASEASAVTEEQTEGSVSAAEEAAPVEEESTPVVEESAGSIMRSNLAKQGRP